MLIIAFPIISICVSCPKHTQPCRDNREHTDTTNNATTTPSSIPSSRKYHGHVAYQFVVYCCCGCAAANRCVGSCSNFARPGRNCGEKENTKQTKEHGHLPLAQKHLPTGTHPLTHPPTNQPVPPPNNPRTTSYNSSLAVRTASNRCAWLGSDPIAGECLRHQIIGMIARGRVRKHLFLEWVLYFHVNRCCVA